MRNIIFTLFACLLLSGCSNSINYYYLDAEVASKHSYQYKFTVILEVKNYPELNKEYQLDDFEGFRSVQVGDSVTLVIKEDRNFTRPFYSYYVKLKDKVEK